MTLGYSNTDPNWNSLFNETISELSPKKLPPAYRISPETESLDEELLRAQGVETISCDYAEFVTSASAELSASRLEPDRLKRIQSLLPSDLQEAFIKNPAAVARLTSSWVYVNQAPFSEKPNIREFLRGDRANWGLIAGSHQFERDIESEVFSEQLLEYATASSINVSSVLLLGPAGYGMTTVLTALAMRLVREHVRPVFMLKLGAPLLEGDVQFAASLFHERPFFFVDNAADHSETLRSLMVTFREQSKSALFVLGERLNEWRQVRARVRGTEYELERLSDDEINRLLDCLKNHGELNQLEYLDRSLQFAVIKSKHDKELLVVMREATEDKRFDAILIDEYHGINVPLAQRLYLTTCCFHQHGGYARDSLLAQLLGVEIADLHSKVGPALDGVVIYECVDEGEGLFAARTRHRMIAQIVWERCGVPAEREKIIQDVLASLNLNYRSDKEAFEQFVRSDRIVDQIRTLDGRIRFFEGACRKEPDNPYIRQHYARMLVRGERYELALGQIDDAIKMGPSIKVLYHTKGTILARLAIEIESVELARKRLVQSEEAFQKSLGIYDRDDYDYHGLAQIYFEWAKRCQSGNEVTEYIAKAEDTISKGLGKVTHRERLWILSGEIQKWLGDEPSRVKALETAVREAPGSIVARYLLGRIYRHRGQIDEAVDMLKSLVSDHPDEFRACVEYALALAGQGKGLNKSIAVLRIGQTHGMRDPRFVATLGGMLFLNGSFTEAIEVFDEARKGGIPGIELHRVLYRPSQRDRPLERVQLTGKIATVGRNFVFIAVPHYPDFYRRGTMLADEPLQKEMRVQFQPGFCASGPVAENIVLGSG